MKLNYKFIFIALFFICFISSRKIKNNRFTSNLKTLELMRQNQDSFDPSKITKYYLDQKPPVDNSIPFIDPLFPPNSNSIEGKDNNGNIIDTTVPIEKADDLMERNVKNGKAPEWKRPKDIFKGKPYLVFKDSIEPDDVKQQKIGNCYFISAIAAVTEFPHLIYQLFRSTKVSANGYYELVLFIDGEWQVVILDDYFVVKGGTSNPKFAKPNGEEIWVMLLEKAWAKVNKGYANIVGGLSKDSYYSLTGYVTDTYKSNEITLDELWLNISNADKNNEILSASTPMGNVVEEQLDNGIVKGHAYTLIGSRKLSVENKEIRLVQLRNPWGHREWNGDWSDNSPLWNDNLKREAKFSTAKDDGIFFMSLEDFVQNFYKTEICHIKYGSLVKSYNIDSIEMTNPIVFNLNIQEESIVDLGTFVRHRRFNRGTNNNPNKITSMLLGSYDNSGNISFIKSGCNGDEYVNLSLKLNSGNYVLWVYNSYFMINDNKPDHFIVRIISQSKRIIFQKVGNDTNGNIIRKLMDKAIGDNSDITPNKGVFIKKGNSLQNTCIGYTRFSLPNDGKSSVNINFDTTSTKNIALLPPYSKNPPNIISFSLLSGKSYIVLGIQTELNSSYKFSLSSTIGVSSKTDESSVDFTENLETSNLLLPSSKMSLTYDYITTEMSEALKAKTFTRRKKNFY